jgi:hypothetical protein
MARTREDSGSLRFSRDEVARLAAALLLSLLMHLTIWGAYHTGEKLGWWQRLHLPLWLQPVKKFALNAQIARDEQPAIYVDVSHADADTPAQSRYYSNKSSRAANSETAQTTAPKIVGTQRDMPKTENASRPVKAAAPAAPAPPNPTEEAKETPKEPAKTEPKEETPPDLARLQPSMPPPSLKTPPLDAPEQPQTPGDFPRQPRPQTTAAPTPDATGSAPSQPARPRTLKQALAQRDQLPGRQMQQEGGVPRRENWAALDVKATPFGDYDRTLIEAVTQRWYDLLDSGRFAQDRAGKVILRFKLKPDGSVIEMETLENTVGDLLGYLCQESVEEAAPFGKWPPDMLRMVGTNYREITFTFYYY